MPTLKRTAALGTLAIILLFAAQAKSQQPAPGYGEPGHHPELSDSAAAHVHLLNELGSRRRSNTLFHNEQGLDQGVQVGYVNVGAGNLTFARRDLVVVGRIPLAFVRVYDSRLPAAADFGEGWRIAAAESLQDTGGELRLNDETGSQIVLRRGRGGTFRPVDAPSSPIIRVTRSAADGSFVAEIEGGWRRTYRLQRSAYRLVHVDDPFGNSVALHYRDGLLSEMVGSNGRVIKVFRNERGRVTSIEDDSGRGVRYEYDQRGRLIAANDLGGNRWAYAYDRAGRLASMQNPEGFEELKATYDAKDRVRTVFSNGAYRSFDYRGRRTEVTGAMGAVGSFLQDHRGVTVEATNYVGDRTHLTWTRDRRVAAVHRNSKVVAQFGYADDRLAAATFHGDEGVSRQITHAWDDLGRLSAVSGNVDSAETTNDITLEYDERGTLTVVRSTGETREYAFSPTGDLTEYRRNGHSYPIGTNDEGQIVFSSAYGKDIRLSYAPNGKISRTTYWDDSSITYEHDALGTRGFADWGARGNVVYIYDRAGNARDIAPTSAAGQPSGHTIGVDEQHRVNEVRYRNGGSFNVTYDGQSNPIRVVSSAGDDSTYDYDVFNRLTRVRSNNAPVLDYVYAPNEADIRSQADHKTMRTLVANRRASVVFGSPFEMLRTRLQGTPYGAVMFDDTLLVFRPVNDRGVILPDTATLDGLTRMRLLGLQRQGFAGKETFEQPSNTLFLPPEYVSINCCIPCSPSMGNLCGTCEWLPGADAPICYCAPTDWCTESPTLNPPPPFTRPPFSPQTTVIGPNGENWGKTDINYIDSTLSCVQICRNNATAYRIQGDFLLNPNYIVIRTHVPANGTCFAAPRTSANISHTEVHELKHANAMLSAINPWKSQIGTEYAELVHCEAALSSLKSIVRSSYNQELSDQRNHVDHAGERRHVAVCPTANGPAAEALCGLGWDCLDVPDFY